MDNGGQLKTGPSFSIAMIVAEGVRKSSLKRMSFFLGCVVRRGHVKFGDGIQMMYAAYLIKKPKNNNRTCNSKAKCIVKSEIAM